MIESSQEEAWMRVGWKWHSRVQLFELFLELFFFFNQQTIEKVIHVAIAVSILFWKS